MVCNDHGIWNVNVNDGGNCGDDRGYGFDCDCMEKNYGTVRNGTEAEKPSQINDKYYGENI